MEQQRSRRALQDAAVLAGVLVALAAVMAFTGMWPTDGNPYPSYRLQAQAWLNGRLDLGQDYPWLELAIYEGKYFVSFPPFPSFVLLPFLALSGGDTPDHLIMLALTVLAVLSALALCRSLREGARDGAFYVLFLFLANGYLFVALCGWVWFMAQSMCFTLSLMALACARKGHGGAALTCWACAVGCRPMVAVYLPMLVYFLWNAQEGENRSLAALARRHVAWLIAPALIALVYMALNLARFGNPLEFGHSYLPEHMRSEAGQFDLSYVAHNIGELFRLPTLDGESGALVFPKFGGVAFWLVNPIFVTALFAWLYAFCKKRRACRFTLFALPAMLLAHLFIVLCHSTLGGWQFGNRYLLDMLPYLFCGLLEWMPEREEFALANMPLMLMGFAVNLLGTVALHNRWI